MAAEAGSLRALFDHCVPHRLRPALKRGFWWGERHVCPVCGAHVRRYLPEGFDVPVLRELDVVGGQRRDEQTCPVCRADSRTRLAWLYATRVANLLAVRVRLLHVAPEIGLYRRLSASANVDYQPGDLEPSLYPWAPRIRRLDLTALPYPDADFDIVIANHVLEHVVDESRALAEIRRVLRPGGWAMLAVPIARKLDHTREDASVVAPEERERAVRPERSPSAVRPRLPAAAGTCGILGRALGRAPRRRRRSDAALAARPARNPSDRDAPARARRHVMARVGPNPLRAALGRSRARVKRWLEPVRYLPFALGHARSPRSITIDPLARCNLRCPLCPTGRGHNTSAGKGILSLSLYSKILDQLPKLRTLLLFNWGEPLLHPQIEEIIAIAHRRGIGVHAHSNLSLKKDDAFFERLIDAGLDSLWVSIDGASEETYSRYRVGGDFGLAIANLERLVKARRRLASKTPRIIWKFIVHRHNEHEVETARRMAREIGVEFTTAPIGLADDLVDYTIGESIEERRREWLPDEPEARAPSYRDDEARTRKPIYEAAARSCSRAR
jgi:SAM-dependent methyltransferase/organic radical activating enzyme